MLRHWVGKRELIFFAALLLLLAAVFGLNIVAVGTITSPTTLAIDLAAPPDTPQAWTVQHWIPTKYRVLFRWIVQGTFALLFSPDDANGFYALFVFWSFFFFYAALIAFYYFLRVLGFDQPYSFIGCLLFLASPPVLLAYKYPVYTREDPLAYLLVTLGLIAVFKSKPIWVSAISAAAALTRETTLIIPLVYLLASSASWRTRVLVCVPPVLATIGVRLALGLAAYDLFEGSLYNFQTPWQSLAFLFVTFGVLWLPFAMQWRDRWRQGVFANDAWRILVHTAPLVLIVVLGTHITLARAREIRISFLLFPWVIPLALDWLGTNSRRLQAFATNPRYWAFALSVLAILSFTILYLHLTNAAMLKEHLADFKNGYWLFLGDVHLAATLAIGASPLFRSRDGARG